MDTTQFLALAEVLRVRALSSGADLNASNYYVHATLMRALGDRPLHEIALNAFEHAAELESATQPS